MSVPILDCSKISGPNSEAENSAGFEEFTEQLGEALKGIGIAYLVNHGISSELVSTFFEKSRRFFELPKDVKERYWKVNAAENFHGYSCAEDENLYEHDIKNALDYNETWDSWGPPDDGKFPTEVPGFRKVFDDLWVDLNTLAKKIFRPLAAVLKLEDPDFFLKRHLHFDDVSVLTQEVLRSYNYFPIDADISEESLRLSEHSDWGTFTFMIPNQVEGFQVQNKINGEWIDVPPKEGTIILCPGLALENWSGGHIQATRHRVRANKDSAQLTRQSCDLYIQPDGNVICTPLIKEIEDWNPKYPKIKKVHFEYFRDRIEGSRKHVQN